MILYTIIPTEVIFAEDEDERPKKRKTIDVGGAKLVVDQASDSEYQIVQLISSDPQQYLDQKLQPGKMVALQPLLK